MSSPKKLSPGYLAAGGDNMTPEQATRFFNNEEIRIKAKIRGLPISEKLRFAADALDESPTLKSLALSVAKLAIAEIEGKGV